ncbi:tetratricopeptide repeat protein [Blautia obeum]|uniref:tetratricopeptide repeat protein n=1 Tax=Blautia obeum TaxID=40520 RepID=UPI003F893128
MKEYYELANVLSDILEDEGVTLLKNSKVLIAIISDYAPNLRKEQLLLRKAIRCGLNEKMLTAIEQRQNRIDFTLNAGSSLRASGFTDEEVKQLLEIAGSTLSCVSSDFSVSLSKEQLFEKGLQYYKLMPKKLNVPIAKEYFTEAYTMGDCESGYYVASLYLKGKYIVPNIELGMTILEDLANRNHVKSQFMYGREILSGINVTKDEEKGLAWIVRAANGGLIDSQIFLGNYYRENDFEKAFFWYLKAADAHEPSSAYEIALAYAMGRGTKRDMKKAKEWLQIAADTGHLEAKKKLEELGVYR